MPGRGIDATLTIALTGILGYFALLDARVLHRYLRFRPMRSAALLAWPAPRPSARALGVALGVVSLALAIAGVALQARLLTVSQGVTALYFLGAVPLLLTIRPGFYVLGIWAEADFVPYGQIARWAIRDSEEIVLLIVRRGQARALRLTVPRGDYGAVRKILQQKAREHALRVDPQILDLTSP
jgi:hypothetical protein